MVIVESLSEAAQQIVRDAKNLAMNSGQAQVEPQHLLKVLLAEKQGVARVILGRIGVSADEVESKLDQILAKMPATDANGDNDLPLSHDAQRVVEIAVADAADMGDTPCIEHLFGGIAGHSVTEVSYMLIDLNAARKRVHRAIEPMRHAARMTAAAIADQAVRDIKSHRQLFIDDYLIGSMFNLKRSFHAMKKHGQPVIQPEGYMLGGGDKPGTNVFVYGDVMWDDEAQHYKMWYTGAVPGSGEFYTLYATSGDAINWEKPNLGLVDFEGSKQNNIVLSGAAPQTVLRRDDVEDPGRRYQMFTHDKACKGFVWRYSADGLRWGEPQSVESLHKFADVGSAGWDNVQQRYVLAIKKGHDFEFAHPVLGKSPGMAYRTWHVTSGSDGATCPRPEPMRGDFDQIDKALYIDGERCLMLNSYGFSLFPYHGMYIGLQWLFRVTDAVGYRNVHGGPMDARLVVSRQWGEPWSIPTRMFALPCGEKGDWDWGMICGVTNRPVVSPDGREWYYYYGGWSHGHGMPQRKANIGLAKLRVDGFASIGSVDTEGQLMTKLLRFEGLRLQLNVDAKAADADHAPHDYVRVALLDEAGNAIEGFSLEDCDAIRADAINHTVTWQGNSDLSQLVRRPVRVLCQIRNAELYAMQFVG